MGATVVDGRRKSDSTSEKIRSPLISLPCYAGLLCACNHYRQSGADLDSLRMGASERRSNGKCFLATGYVSCGSGLTYCVKFVPPFPASWLQWWRSPRFVIVFALCASVLAHLTLGFGGTWFLLERRAAPDPESAGAGVLRVHLARRTLVQGDPEQKVSRLSRAPEPLQNDESAGHSDETVAGPSAAAPGDQYLLGKELDFPAEFARLVDFDSALQGLPIVPATVRVRIFVDAHGKVHKLDWQASKAPPDVIARLDEYLRDQPFRPARKAGRDVASVLTIEFEIGPPRIVQPGFSDVPVIQEASPPASR